MKPALVKGVAVLAILVGGAVLAIEISRYRSGAGVEIWLWGMIALFAIAFGLAELLATRDQ